MEGRIVWQRVLNTTVSDGSDLMRVDIPKDDVLRGYQRVNGKHDQELGFLIQSRP